MDDDGVLGAIRRRWLLLAIGVAVTLVLCLAAARLVPGQYVVTARALLVPSTPADEPLANPYLALGGLEPATSVLARTMSSAEGTRELRRSGATADFTIDQDALTAGPVLLVEVRDDTADVALGTLTLVLQQLPKTLRELQSQVGVPAGSMIKSAVISQDVRPVVVRRSQVRAVIVAAAGGAGGTLLVICLVDAFIRRRRDPSAADGPSVRSGAEYEPAHLLPDGKKQRRDPTSPQQSQAPTDAAL